MEFVEIIEQVTGWLNSNVCPEIKLKVPPGDREAQDDGYGYRAESPTAFPLFIPARDKLPPGVEVNFPCIAVQLVNGQDNLARHDRRALLALGFGAWSPGTHEEDWVNIAGKEFRKDMGGWRDAWNMVDIASRKIQSATYLGKDLEVMMGEPFTYGPYRLPKQNDEDEWQDSYYPFWFAYLQFTVRCELYRNNPDFEQYL